MKGPFLAIVADVHMGNHRVFGGDVERGLNQRAWAVADALRMAVDKARDDGASALVIAGDVFDDCRPHPQMLAVVGGILRGASPLTVYVLRGNHDTHSDEDGDHALGPLQLVGNVVVVESPQTLTLDGEKRTGVVLLPWMPGNAREWVREAAQNKIGGGQAVVVSHFGIVDADTPAFLRDSSGALSVEELREIMQLEGVFAWWSGDWHERKVHVEPDGSVIGQVGALVPTGFDNPGTPYGSLIYQPLTPGQAHEVHEIPGPRFLTLDYSRAEQAPMDVELHTALACGLGRDLHVRVRGLREHLPALRLELASARSNGLVRDFELVAVAAQESREAAREGAEKARSAETLDEAAGAFLKGMALEDEALREEVTTTVRRYLAAGGGA